MNAVEKIFRWVARGHACEQRAIKIDYGHGICEEPMVTFCANGASFSYDLGGIEKALAGSWRERSELADGLRSVRSLTSEPKKGN